MKKDLTQYRFPEDLKNMSDEEMELLSYAIREFLIEHVSKTGGHLASNLGVVELTIALHKIFDSPRDKIIWDVGHQSYVHKILTGRADAFDTLRQFGGLSGFPKGKESAHDAFDTGHSSTSISAAAGYAAARDIQGEDYEVVAVIGDGSLTGGMAYEALNNIGASKSKLIVILNDNGMSISPNIGGISRHLGSLRTSKGYLSAKSFVKNKIGAIPSVGKGIAQGLADIKNDIKYTILERGGVLFEELGFTYFGPVDGHHLPELLDVLSKAKNLNEPVLIHVITKKGKGYRNAEQNPGKFHGIGSFDPETGKEAAKSEKPTYSKVMGEYLTELAKKDPRVVAITAAMGEATGLGGFAEKFPERFFDVGIAEQHAVTFAAGLAKAGMRPFVCIYSSFLQRAYDQMLEDVCMQELPVTFMIDRAGIVGADGETHHGIFDLSYLATMPQLTVLAPTSDEMLRASMDVAMEQVGPCAIRYPRGEVMTEEEGRIPSLMYYNRTMEYGNTLLTDRVEILGVGKMAGIGREVFVRLLEKGVQARYQDVNIVKPIKTSVNAMNTLRGDLIVTIEDNIVSGGFGESLRGALEPKHRLLNFGWPDRFIEQGTFDELTEKYGLSAAKITERICEELERKA